MDAAKLQQQSIACINIPVFHVLLPYQDSSLSEYWCVGLKMAADLTLITYSTSYRFVLLNYLTVRKPQGYAGLIYLKSKLLI